MRLLYGQYLKRKKIKKKNTAHSCPLGVIQESRYQTLIQLIMKKTISILFLLLLLLNSCSNFLGIYKFNLSEVERKDKLSNSEPITSSFQKNDSLVFENNQLKIVWFPSTSDFRFILTNKSTNNMKIIWDESVYVNTDGFCRMVMHQGTRFIDKNITQKPSVIVKGGKIEDLILPTENVYFVNGQYGGWQTMPLFKVWLNTLEEFDVIKKAYVGKTVKILLPISIENSIQEYLFTFRIEDFHRKVY